MTVSTSTCVSNNYVNFNSRDYDEDGNGGFPLTISRRLTLKTVERARVLAGSIKGLESAQPGASDLKKLEEATLWNCIL